MVCGHNVTANHSLCGCSFLTKKELENPCLNYGLGSYRRNILTRSAQPKSVHSLNFSALAYSMEVGQRKKWLFKTGQLLSCSPVTY